MAYTRHNHHIYGSPFEGADRYIKTPCGGEGTCHECSVDSMLYWRNRVLLPEEKIDRWSRRVWHVSQHNRMVIGLAGRLQKLANEMREAIGLEPFGWNDAVLDAEFGECSVHVEGCLGQETH